MQHLGFVGQIARAFINSKLTPQIVVPMVDIYLALAGVRDISSRKAKVLLEKNKNIFLRDVRTPQENSQARLPGSRLIPIAEFERRSAEVPKNKTILAQCAVGSRSKPVAELLAQRGYREVYNMTDGIVGWYRNGFPLQR